MDTNEIYLPRREEREDGWWGVYAGDRLLAWQQTQRDAINYIDGYNQALHDFLLPPSIYDEVEDED